MALRTLLWFGETPGRCLLTGAHCHRTLLETPSSSKYVRGFKRLRDSTKQTNLPLSSSLTNTTALGGQLWKPFGFTIIFGSTVHIGATIWEYEKMRSQAYKAFNRYHQWRVAKKGWREDLRIWWRGLSEGQRVFAPICFLNAVVFLAWRVPQWRTIMTRYFCSNPSSRAVCWPMLLSTFSHSSALHFAVNMYVLHSFSTAAVNALGPEQFVALYLTSGVVSSCASHFYKSILLKPGLSLGASGSIMGIVSFVCMQYPDSKLAIAFLPMITFSAASALAGLLCMDTMGCILGWRFFDHAAHLGGAMWGIFWQTWGNAHIWQKRESVLSIWHNLRDPKRRD